MVTIQCLKWFANLHVIILAIRMYFMFSIISYCALVKTNDLNFPMNENVIDEMMKSGLYRFWMGNQLFYIEVLPIAFQVNGYNFLREEAKTILLPARGNERIFEFNDVMQLDFFMLRFNSNVK